MSSYTPPYKLSQKAGKTTSKETALEGISAFLSRVEAARRERDQREDLEMQEKVTRGEVSVDEQISYNRTRQKRYTKDSVEYNQMANNIADLETAKKWQVYRDMESTAVDRTSQKAFIESWLSMVEEGSKLSKELGEETGRLNVQIARDNYDKSYQSTKTKFDQGQIKRTNLITFLNSQLSAATDEDLRSKIQGQLDTENTNLQQDADDFRNTTIASFDRTGDIEDEGKFLGLLEDDYSMDLLDGDAASAIQRQGDMDTHKRYLTSLSVQKQLDGAYSEWLGKQNVDANESYLTELQQVSDLNNITVSYEGADGSKKSFITNGLKNYQFNFGDLNNTTLSAGMGDKINKFVTQTYIPDYANKITADFNSQATKVGASYVSLKQVAQNSMQQWSQFASKGFLAPFAEKLNEYGVGSQGVQKSLLNGLFSSVQTESSGNTIENDRTLSHLKEMRTMFPDVAGSDFQQSINNFISQRYIPEFADKIRNEFGALKNTAGVDFETLKSKALQLDQAWKEFSTDQNVIPFKDQLDAQRSGDSGALSYMLSGLLDSLGNKYSSGELDDFGTLQELGNLKKMLPSVAGTAFEGQYQEVERDIAQTNWDKFMNQAQQDFAQTNDKQAEFTSAKNMLNVMYQNGNIGNDEYLRLSQEIDANILEFTKGYSQFSNKYGQNYLGQGTNYKEFLPYAKGKVRTPTYNAPKQISSVGQLTGIKDITKLNKIGFKVPGTEFLSLLKPDQYFKSQFGNQIYAKAGVEQPWGEKIPNSQALGLYGQEETMKIGNSQYLKPGIDKRW